MPVLTGRTPGNHRSGEAGLRVASVGGTARRTPSDRRHLSRCLVAVDVLVEAARPRTRVPGDRSIGKHGPALKHVRARIVIVVAGLPRIHTGDRVAVVRPYPEGRAAERADPDVVTEEWHGSAAELLVVRIRADVADSGGRRER